MLTSVPEDDTTTSSSKDGSDMAECDKPSEMAEKWDVGIHPNNQDDGQQVFAPNADLGRGEEEDEEETITGVLVGKCIRGYYTTLNLIVVGDNPLVDPIDDENDHYHVLVRIQYNDSTNSVPATTIQELRSYWRRYCKNGDLLHIRRGTWQDATFTEIEMDRNEQQTIIMGTPAAAAIMEEPAWREPRFVVSVRSVEQAQCLVQRQQERFFTVSQCQAWQERLYRCQLRQQCRRDAKKPQDKKRQDEPSSCNAHHSGGLEKRQQGEFVANFLLHMIMASIVDTSDGTDTSNNNNNGKNHDQVFLEDPSTWCNPFSSLPGDTLVKRRQAALDYLNGGSGVLDVAGGSGHVSMALGMIGVQSTIVDPRETVGKLPGRDRKIWNRALYKRPQKADKNKEKDTSGSENDSSTSTSPMMFCQPVRPFQTLRAWFGTPPPGLHPHYRNPNSDTVPVLLCNDNHELVQNCRAIVALHPDEATDAIVDMAVNNKIPLVIVPCCVFCRLFPHRKMPGPNGGGAMVSTYQDLLVYLQAKDPTIQKGTLPFVGANTVLYRPLERSEKLQV
jgi:hypothetical protein